VVCTYRPAQFALTDWPNLHLQTGSICTYRPNQFAVTDRPNLHLHPGRPNLHLQTGQICTYRPAQFSFTDRLNLHLQTGPICNYRAAQFTLTDRPNSHIPDNFSTRLFLAVPRSFIQTRVALVTTLPVALMYDSICLTQSFLPFTSFPSLSVSHL
jgi:hypothetical protein